MSLKININEGDAQYLKILGAVLMVAGAIFSGALAFIIGGVFICLGIFCRNR